MFLLTLLLVSGSVSAASADEITVKIDNQKIDFDVAPQLINNRTMVPVRAIFEALGATVDWDDCTQTVTSVKGNTTIRLTINSPVMFVNGSPVTLDSPACVFNGRTLVPVRAVSEAFGINVDWNNATNSILITTANSNRAVGGGQQIILPDTADMNNQCYPNTIIPDYTAVTDVPLKSVSSAENDMFSKYIYEYTQTGEYSEIIDYIAYLSKTGWEPVKEINDTEKLYMAWFFCKNDAAVSVSYMAEFDEVWIMFQK